MQKYEIRYQIFRKSGMNKERMRKYEIKFQIFLEKWHE